MPGEHPCCDVTNHRKVSVVFWLKILKQGTGEIDKKVALKEEHQLSRL
jgi:hypothetical protein